MEEERDKLCEELEVEIQMLISVHKDELTLRDIVGILESIKLFHQKERQLDKT